MRRDLTIKRAALGQTLHIDPTGGFAEPVRQRRSDDVASSFEEDSVRLIRAIRSQAHYVSRSTTNPLHDPGVGFSPAIGNHPLLQRNAYAMSSVSIGACQRCCCTGTSCRVGLLGRSCPNWRLHRGVLPRWAPSPRRVRHSLWLWRPGGGTPESRYRLTARYTAPRRG